MFPVTTVEDQVMTSLFLQLTWPMILYASVCLRCKPEWQHIFGVTVKSPLTAPRPFWEFNTKQTAQKCFFPNTLGATFQPKREGGSPLL